MSYIEDLAWKNNKGEPIMNIAQFDHTALFYPFGAFLGVTVRDWCKHCQNPSWKWTIYDNSGGIAEISIGGYVTEEPCKSDMFTEMDNLS